jgi:hypothetical protein
LRHQNKQVVKILPEVDASTDGALGIDASVVRQQGDNRQFVRIEEDVLIDWIAEKQLRHSIKYQINLSLARG